MELCHGTDFLNRMIGNFKLPLLCNVPSFEPMIAALRRLAEVVSGVVTRESATPVSSLTGDAAINGPLGSMMAQTLDVWCALVADPLVSGTSSPLSEEEVWLARRLQAGFRPICGDVFQGFCTGLILAVIQDTLQSQDEELDVENDEIAERWGLLITN
jgi:hypothetical protein